MRGAKIAAPCSVRAFHPDTKASIRARRSHSFDGVTVGQNRRLRLNIAFQ